jgi:tetratricopeptide (TPR) repeat protein
MYHNKGIVLELLGRNKEALIAFTAALEIQKKLYPDGHRYLTCLLSRIGNQYRIKKNFPLAKKYCDEAIAMQKRILPADDPDTYLTLYHIGLISYDQQDFKESLSSLWKSFRSWKGCVDEMSNIYQGLTLTAIRDINRQLGNMNIPLVLRCYKDTLSFYEIFFSNDHPMILELRGKIRVLEGDTKAT